ncbi:MAG: cation:proton antiporter [Candidatus Aminicenantes bacterium]|nr:MAG: cation:proton antiporter [Candidatus Aminicenantes bacterium]
MQINYILFLVSLIVLLGYLAEWVFKKINIPDTLLLIAVGFIIGPHILGYIEADSLGQLAPLFTTFTLLFLMFDGALSIDLHSFAEGIGSGISIGSFNFFLSTLVIGGVFYFLVHDVILALMLGFSLGGVSSAFVIPMLKQITVNKKTYSILTLESALTDVLSIVFALTMMELKIMKTFEMGSVLSQIASLFFVAGVMGILAGCLWIFIEGRLIERDTNYMMSIAYVVLLYFISEYLGGNGAIAAMSFGIVIANSKILMNLAQKFKEKRGKKKVVPEEEPAKTVNIVSRRERMFYQEISFFLKTFFFVYIGLLLNINNLTAAAVGIGIAASVLLLRNLTYLLTKTFKQYDRLLINSLFARGIAPAAIILMAKVKNLSIDQNIIDTVYFTITATIILSSLKVFIYKIKVKKRPGSQ